MSTNSVLKLLVLLNHQSHPTHQSHPVSSSSFSVQASVFSRIDALLGEFRVGGGVHGSYTFPYGLVGSFTSPGIDTR